MDKHWDYTNIPIFPQKRTRCNQNNIHTHTQTCQQHMHPDIHEWVYTNEKTKTTITRGYIITIYRQTIISADLIYRLECNHFHTKLTSACDNQRSRVTSIVVAYSHIRSLTHWITCLLLIHPLTLLTFSMITIGIQSEIHRWSTKIMIINLKKSLILINNNNKKWSTDSNLRRPTVWGINCATFNIKRHFTVLMNSSITLPETHT